MPFYDPINNTFSRWYRSCKSFYTNKKKEFYNKEINFIKNKKSAINDKVSGIFIGIYRTFQ